MTKEQILSLVGVDDLETRDAVDALFEALEKEGIYPARQAIRSFLAQVKRQATHKELPHLQEIEDALAFKRAS